jgi:ABC-type polysaccharide/polyol phosphate transport system ATPase subunit/glycosyltransferase involved in cell wall biosynthesis
MESDEPVVRVSGLSKVYPHPSAGALFGNFGRSLLGRPLVGTRALDEIDFSVARGEALGIVGRNGSGKSTLLQILAGALQPTAGTVDVRGRLGTLLDLTAGINPEYTGRENALVLGMLAGLSRSDVRSRMEEIKAFSGLGDAFDRTVKGYSSGMGMRLGFSAAIHSDPEVLLIDEALAVGDAFYQQRCLRKMRSLRDEGVTIVLVTHDPSAVISLCDRAIWLESGRMNEMGTPKDVLRLYLAARYQDDCDLGGALEPVASLDPGVEESFAPAAPIARLDERFGDARAQVRGFEMRNAKGDSLTTVAPGDAVQVVMSVEASAQLDHPLVGFTIRNRLGDVVTATNTEHEGIAMPALSAGATLDIAFRLTWPALSSGPFTLSPAVADGSIAAHAMCDWVENALIVECENERGLFGWLTLQDVSIAMGRLRGLPETVASDSIVGGKRGNGSERRAAEELIEGQAAGGDGIEFALDEPREARVDAANLTTEHELLFSGWSFSTSGERVEIAIRVEGREGELVVETGGFREDVARVHSGVPQAGRSGFSAMVPMPRQVGPTRCQVEVRTPSTTRVAAEFEIDLPPRSLVVEDAEVWKPRGVRREGPQRILFVTHTLNLEGAPRSLFEMARGLPRDEFEAHVLSPVEGPLGAEWEGAGFAKRILPVDVRVGGRDDYDAMIRRLAGLISVGRPDLVVANTLESFWAIHVARELGIEAVLIVRESEDPASYFHSRLPTRIAERGVHSLEVSNRVVFVAEATRALFRSKLAPDQSVVIPNGLDLETLDEVSGSAAAETVRKRAGVDSGTPLLLCVGTPCARKGQLELLAALAQLRERGFEFRCIFLGTTDGEYLERMRDSIERSGLGAHVDFIPPTREPLPYFAATDLLVCPSFQESLPRVVLEAMAFATPIVATGVFGVPELIRDGKEGRLVEAGDVDAMTEAIAELLGDRDRASALGRQARLRVEAKFTLETCVQDYAALFREALGKVEVPVAQDFEAGLA